MFGIFLSFVLPGIVIGVLIGISAKAAASRKSLKQQQEEKRAHACNQHRAPVDKNRLYVYDLKEDYKTSNAA